MRFGLQMFGLNPVFRKDPESFLIKAKELNYRFIEPCISLSGIPGLEDRVWTPNDCELYYPLLKKHGFSINSCHLFSGNPASEAEKLVMVAQKYGIRQFILPCPSFASEDEGNALAESLKDVALIFKEAGIQTLIHNNRDECTARINGISNYEWLLHQVGSEIGAQADIGWLSYGGIDPEAFLWRNEDQIWSIHYKDMQKSADGSLTEASIGRGLVDFSACFQFARAREIIQLVDQDIYPDDVFNDLSYVARRFAESGQCRDNTSSILCIYDVDTGKVEKIREFDRIVEAPNWSQSDSDTLIYNSEGKIWKYSLSRDSEEVIPTGHCVNCNNDHVLSPDNTQIAVSHSEIGWMSQIYICNLDGTGDPTLITSNFPSFLHGWSIDGKELAYCAFRESGVDIYAISNEGGQEKQLTHNAGFNDGPEYAPNNKDIWFISTRSGLMQCWKMNRDGTEPKQMSFTERNNWFPHVSPDGKLVVYISYSKDGLDPDEHLSNMHVQLRMMNYDGTDDRCILDFFGGQGSINVNSWKSDSRKFAFFMYELHHK